MSISIVGGFTARVNGVNIQIDPLPGAIVQDIAVKDGALPVPEAATVQTKVATAPTPPAAGASELGQLLAIGFRGKVNSDGQMVDNSGNLIIKPRDTSMQQHYANAQALLDDVFASNTVDKIKCDGGFVAGTGTNPGTTIGYGSNPNGSVDLLTTSPVPTVVQALDLPVPAAADAGDQVFTVDWPKGAEQTDFYTTGFGLGSVTLLFNVPAASPKGSGFIKAFERPGQQAELRHYVVTANDGTKLVDGTDTAPFFGWDVNNGGDKGDAHFQPGQNRLVFTNVALPAGQTSNMRIIVRYPQ